MVNYARIQHHIDKGLKIAATKLGPPFTAYRCPKSGDFPDDWQVVANNVFIKRERVSEREIESALEYSGTVWYELVINTEPFLLGDVFVSIDPTYSPGIAYGVGATALADSLQFNGVALVWHSPVNKPIGARIDRRCRIMRPQSLPDASRADGTPIWRATNDRARPLILEGGSLVASTAGQDASWLPIGVSSTARPGRGSQFPPSPPGMVQPPRYYAYIPPMPGYHPSEGDRVILEDGSRYVVLNPYDQEQGVVGYQLALERVIAQA